MPLVSDSEMVAIRTVYEDGMVDDVTVLPRVKVDNPYGDEQTVTWPESGGFTVKGWIRTVPEGTIDVVSGVMADVATFRLSVPVGTAISNGDRVLIDGLSFTVTDTNKESTYQTALKCSLKRAE